MKKSLCIVPILGVLFAANVHAAPLDLSGKQYDLSGKIKVKVKAKCNGYGGKAQGASPTKISASLRFAPSANSAGDEFEWFGDTLLPPGATAKGEIVDRGGDRLTFQFAGEGAESAGSILYRMAGIPPTASQGGVLTFGNYAFTGKVVKAGKKGSRLLVTEKVTASAKTQTGPYSCTFNWTVSRSLSGFEAP